MAKDMEGDESSEKGSNVHFGAERAKHHGRKKSKRKKHGRMMKARK